MPTKKVWLVFGIASLLVFVIWLLLLSFLIFGQHVILVENLNDLSSFLGPFGDSFGIINSLFTGIALAGIVTAIFIQADQLSDQKENLDLYREEQRWSRLKSKLEFAPSLLASNMQKLRGLIGSEIEIAEDIWEKPDAQSEIYSFLSNRELRGGDISWSFDLQTANASREIEELTLQILAIEKELGDIYDSRLEIGRRNTGKTTEEMPAEDINEIASLDERQQELKLKGCSAKERKSETEKQKQRIENYKQAKALLDEIIAIKEELDDAYRQARSR